MEFKRLGMRMLILTVLALILMNLIDFNQYFRIFLGAFGIGGGVILLIIGNASRHHDE